MNIAAIFSGGSGVRMGAGIPKQFLQVNGKPILVHTLQLFQYHDQIDKIYISVIEEYIDYVWDLVEEYHLTKVCGVMAGGETAQDSIYNALKEIEKENDPDSIVLLHDGVRPFVSYETIANNIEGVKEYGNAITCTACFETILLSEGGETVDSVPFRKNTYAAQAPQSFRLQDIIAAHDEIRARPSRYENMVDGCTIIKTLGKEAHMVEGNRGNIKVTTPEDVYIMRGLLQYQENEQAFGLASTSLESKMNSAKRRHNQNRGNSNGTA
jgi:2-C-methyl-D-erythritol 4-phosphate cytidylyltransferase